MRRVALQEVVIHGHDVRYRRAGDADAESILLIHGLAGSSKTWDGVIPLLADRCDVIAPDLLGHGESAKPLGDYSLGAFASGLRDFLTVLGVERVTILGHSFGGGVAMQLAYQHPELVDRLILVGSGGLGREVSWLLRLLAVPGFEYLMPIWFPRPFVDAGTSVGRNLRRRGINSGRFGEMWRAYASLAAASNRTAFVRTMQGVIDPWGQKIDARDRLYLARVPTLLVWGDRDAIIPVAHGHAAHEAIDDSELVIMEGLGHFPHLEDPDRFTSVLSDFLGSTAPGPIDDRSLRDLMTSRAIDRPAERLSS